MTTRAAFLAEYEKTTIRTQAWATDEVKVEKFMDSVRWTIGGPGTTWTWNSKGAKAAWKAIGCKGPMTLKALRALP